jgi:hypothetical protein
VPRPFWSLCSILSVCAGLLSACAGASHLGAALPDDSFVLLDPAVKFYAEPSESADSFALVLSEVAALPLRAAGAFHAYRLLRDGGDWLEVETPGPLDDQCAADDPAFAPLRLRLFVRSTDAVLATRREVYLHFDDGSAARLVAGVPVVGTLVHAGELLLSLALPDDAIGRAYRGGGRFETPPSERQLSATDLAGASVGGRPLRRGAGGLLPVYATQPGLSGTVAKLRTRCVELEALVAPEMVKPISPATEIHHAAVAVAPLHARAGATIYWKSGRVAGQTRGEVDFVDAAGTAGGRRCFRWTPSERRKKPEPGALVTLCFDPADVTQ